MAARWLRFGRSVNITGGVLAGGFVLDQTDFFHSDLATVRMLRVAVMSLKFAVDYKYTLFRLRNTDSESEEYKQRLSSAHLRGAHRLLDLCRSNRGVFAKLIQHAASLQFVLPLEYYTVLHNVRSVVQESSYDEVASVFHAEFGKEIKEVFSEFDESPISVTSIAQVHLARLGCNGEEVAVKIQHKEIATRAWWDMSIIETCLSIGDYAFPKFQFMWLYEETLKNLPYELDQTCAARNADASRAIYGQLGYVHVPHVYHELTSTRVLTMEHVRGVYIDDTVGLRLLGLSPTDIGKQLGELYSAMLFKYGFIHYDPAPKNILVNLFNGKPKFILLNHDLYMQLDDSFRRNFCQLWKAIFLSNGDEVKRIGAQLGISTLFDYFGFELGSDEAKAKANETTEESKKDDAPVEPIDITTFNLKLISSLVLILRINDMLAATEQQLGLHKTLDVFLEVGGELLSAANARCLQLSKRCTRQCYRHEMEAARGIGAKSRALIELFDVLGKVLLYQTYLLLSTSLTWTATTCASFVASLYKQTFATVIFSRRSRKAVA